MVVANDADATAILDLDAFVLDDVMMTDEQEIVGNQLLMWLLAHTTKHSSNHVNHFDLMGSGHRSLYFPEINHVLENVWWILDTKCHQELYKNVCRKRFSLAYCPKLYYRVTPGR